VSSPVAGDAGMTRIRESRFLMPLHANESESRTKSDQYGRLGTIISTEAVTVSKEQYGRIRGVWILRPRRSKNNGKLLWKTCARSRFGHLSMWRHARCTTSRITAAQSCQNVRPRKYMVRHPPQDQTAFLATSVWTHSTIHPEPKPRIASLIASP